MQPTLCSKCKKNVAVVFISRMNEKGEPVNEGLCLKCAAQLGLPQVEDMMKRMGITDGGSGESQQRDDAGLRRRARSWRTAWRRPMRTVTRRRRAARPPPSPS